MSSYEERLPREVQLEITRHLSLKDSFRARRVSPSWKHWLETTPSLAEVKWTRSPQEWTEEYANYITIDDDEYHNDNDYDSEYEEERERFNERKMIRNPGLKPIVSESTWMTMWNDAGDMPRTDAEILIRLRSLKKVKPRLEKLLGTNSGQKSSLLNLNAFESWPPPDLMSVTKITVKARAATRDGGREWQLRLGRPQDPMTCSQLLRAIDEFVKDLEDEEEEGDRAAWEGRWEDSEEGEE